MKIKDFFRSKVFLVGLFFLAKLFLLSLICFTFSYLMLVLSFYLHEGGHIVGNFFDSLVIKREWIVPHFYNWVEIPPFGLKAPQSTYMEHMSILSFFGGIFITSLLAILLTYLYLKFSKKNYKKVSLLILLVFLFHEIIGNFLCGTDNFRLSPHKICNNSFFLQEMSSITLKL